MSQSSAGALKVLDEVARAWSSRREDFEAACRTGSGSRGEPPAVDGLVQDLAHLFEDLARKELEAIREHYFAPGGGPNPNCTADYTPVLPGAVTPDGKPDRTVDFTPSPDVRSLADRFDTTGQYESNPQESGAFLVDPAFEATVERKMPTIPGYDITGVLGRGGMGIVYKAKQAGLNRDVALKMILKGEHASSSAVVRFLTEARAIAALNHPNIVQVYEINEHDDLPYFSLEYCPGGSLDKSLKKEPQAPGRAAELAETIARGLAVAHRAGVLHRDIKPANVLLDANGTPKITDFGLARLADDESGLTATTAVLGSPSYMPPEQASGTMDRVGPASDQYSLGASLYEFITGRPPFQGTTQIETLKQVRENEPLPPSKLQPTCPKDLETICLKALSKEIEKRYPSVEAFADDLKAFRDGRPIAARPVGRAERVWRWAKRNPKVAALSAGLAGVAAMLLVGATLAAVVFREKNAQLTTALGDAKEQKKQSDENYAFARENGVLMIREMPRLIERQVLTQGAKADFATIVKQLTRASQSGLRSLPDRMLLYALSTQGDELYFNGQVHEAEQSYRSAAQLAEKLREQEPVEKDKANGLVANVQLILAQCSRAKYFLMARLTPKKAATVFSAALGSLPAMEIESNHAARAKELMSVAIAQYESALNLQRARLEKPESKELPENERRYNVADVLGRFSGVFFPDPESGNYSAGVPITADNANQSMKYLSEAIGILERVTEEPLTEGTRYKAWPQLASLRQKLSRIHRLRGEGDRSEQMLKASIAATVRAIEEDPSPNNRLQLSRRSRLLGDHYVFSNRRPLAAEWDANALAGMQEILLVPQLLEMAEELASDHYRVATDNLASDPPLALAHYRNCLRWRELLQSYKPSGDELAFQVLTAAARCGRTLSTEKECDRILGLLKKQPDVDRLRQLGLVYAVCHGTAGTADEVGLPQAERDERSKRCAAKACECFDLAVTVIAAAPGAQPRISRFLNRLELDPDADEVRKTTKFQELLQRATTRN